MAAAVVFRVLSVLQPWRWLTPKHSELSRDWFQVLILTLLFPWNLLRWKNRARQIAQDYTNTELARGLAATQARVTIASYGYRFVIAPILREMGVPHSQLVACRFWGAYCDRVKGKVELLGLNMRPEVEGKLIAVTDSDADAPLLERCHFPFLIEWPEAKSRAPFQEIYLPFLYLTKVKWPGKNYLQRNIAGDDLPLFLLAFALTTATPLWTGLVLGLLMVSFWCIYERGYNENDELGELKEEDPKLSEAYHQKICRVPEGAAWGWALVLGFLGVLVNVGSQTGFFEARSLESLWRSMAIWAVILVGCRLIFSVYNNSRKSIRPALYPILQLYRYMGIVALLPISLIGSIALLSQVTARSLNYLAYRKSGGKEWPEVPEQIIRLGIFTLLLCALAPMPQVEILSPITFLIFFWFLFRASKQIFRFVGPLVSPQKAQRTIEAVASKDSAKAQPRSSEQRPQDLV